MAASTPTTTNALSILISALPSDVVSDLNSVLAPFTEPTSSSTIRDANATPTGTSALVTSDPTTSTQKQLSTGLTSTPSTLMTIASNPTSLQASTASASSTSIPAPTAAPSHSGGTMANASVIGIATGIVAAFVVVGLLAVLLLRRRGQKKYPFAGRRTNSRDSSKRGSRRIFPEVAWLYDPARTPPNEPNEHMSRGAGYDARDARDESATSLVHSPVPEPREGTVEMGQRSPPLGGGFHASSPLLAPEAAASRRDESPSPHRYSGERRYSSGGASRSPSPASLGGARRNRSSLAVNRVDPRPMSAIFEDVPARSRPRGDSLQPPVQNFSRHST